jgi:peptide/nickel transport system substrate-binding protein
VRHKITATEIDLKPIDAASYYTFLGRKDNPCDLYRTGWGSDWPSGSTIIPPLLDGRSIQPTGNQDYSYYNSDVTNAQIDKISAETDATQAAKDWAELDKQIMQNDAPLIPILNDRNYTLIGSKVGGAFLSAAFGATSLNTVFVKT